MELIEKGNERAAKLSEALRPDPKALYRLSAFVYLYSENGVHLAANTLTGQVLRLDARERAALDALEAGPLSWAYLAEQGLGELAKRRFLVERDWDDTEQDRQTRALIKLMNPEKPGIARYTILPTTACNARCTYCFEEGYPILTMTERTAARLVDYICETKREGKIRLHWFGGEPLLCPGTIRAICRELTARGVDFYSSVVTNGSLLTPALVQEARELWRLEKAQISLDGDRESYRLRKRYLDQSVDQYDVVMRNTRLLAEAGVEVSLRVNCDRENLAGLKGFFEEMNALLGDLEGVSLYLSTLDGDREAPDAAALERALARYTDLLEALAPRLAEKAAFGSIRLRACIADDVEHNVSVSPDGGLYGCAACLPGQSWGNLFDGVTDEALYARMRTPAAPREECRRCLFLPQCTPALRKICPRTGTAEACRELRRLNLERFLHGLIREKEAKPQNVH